MSKNGLKRKGAKVKKKPKYLKSWKELSKEERTPEEWHYRTEKICPFTRKPCTELIDPWKSKEEPENWRECAFYDTEWEECKFLVFLKGFESMESLVEILGVFLHKKVTGNLPRLNKEPRFWEWEI